jgi:hypothetical protein
MAHWEEYRISGISKIALMAIVFEYRKIWLE